MRIVNKYLPFLGGFYILLSLGGMTGMAACRTAGFKGAADAVQTDLASDSVGSSVMRSVVAVPVHAEPLSATECRLEQLGLVDVAPLDSSIVVHLVYATPDNFIGQVLYGDLKRAYLQPAVAAKLLKAQQALKRLNPSLSLIVYDAARPMAVQRTMWDWVKGTPQDIYVSDPTRGGGLHNYGAAVDVSLIDAAGNVLPMGTVFDHFGEEAHIDREEELVAQGLISAQELENRLLLRRVMREAGFLPLRSEWWHFNAMSREEARKRLPVIE